MRDDYKIHGATAKVQLDVEKSVAEKLQMMEKFTKLSQSEIANTALKRFITQHKDFLPAQEEEAKFR
jgi:hypothetical protein